MRPLQLISILATATLTTFALAQKADVSGAVATGPGQAKAVAVVTASGAIESIDAAARTVKLKFDDGGTRDVQLGNEVRNFDQLKVGDAVKVKYTESVALKLVKGGGGAVGRKEDVVLDRAKPGEKPGGVAMQEVTVLVNVVNVDAAKHLVQVQNDRGEVIDLNVKDPKQLELIQKGDQVEATYTVALAVAVTPAAK